MSFTENEPGYFRKYILGFDPDKEPVYFDNDENSEFAGPEKGTIVHKVLENISSWLKSDGKTNRKELSNTIENVISEIPGDYNKYSDKILEEIISLSSTELIKKSAKRIQNAENEVFMSIPVGNDILNGTIDMIIRDPAGNMEIWDWKTNKAENAGNLDKLSDHYLLQMKIYAYFLSMQYPSQKQYKARLLFTSMAMPDCDDSQWVRSHVWNRKELINFGKQLEILHKEMKKFS